MRHIVTLFALGYLVISAAAAGGQVDPNRYKEFATLRGAYDAATPQSYKNAITAALAAPPPAPQHLPYTIDLKQQIAAMVTIDDPKLSTQRCDLLPDASAAVKALIAEANRETVAAGYELRAASCFRSPDEQVAIFCNRKAGPTAPCIAPATRVRESAPSGYSEHGTGYTLDFVIRKKGTQRAPVTNWCANEPCGQISTYAIGAWLLKNAYRHGFELSFPCHNAQHVMYEPWHWRWVGNARARTTFTTARLRFPAHPRILDNGSAVTSPVVTSCA